MMRTIQIVAIGEEPITMNAPVIDVEGGVLFIRDEQRKLLAVFKYWDYFKVV